MQLNARLLVLITIHTGYLILMARGLMGGAQVACQLQEMVTLPYRI